MDAHTDIQQPRAQLYLIGLRAFWRSIKPYQTMFWLLVGLSLVMGFAATYVRVVAGHIIDAFTASDKPLVVQYLLTVTAIYIVDSVARRYFAFYKVRTGYLMQLWYRTELYKKMTRVRSAFIKQKNIGQITIVIARGAEGVSTVGRQFIIETLAPLASGIVALIYLFVQSTFFGLVVIGGLFLYILVLAIWNPRAVRSQRRVREETKQFYGYVTDMVSNIFLVKQSATEQYESQRIEEGSQAMSLRSREYVLNWTRMSMWQNLVERGTEISLYAISVYLIFTYSSMTVGQLVVVISLYSQVFRPVSVVADNYRSFVNALTDIESSEELYNEPEEDYVSGVVVTNNFTPSIEFQSVSFAYADNPLVPVLENVSFAIPAGTQTAFVSTSGGGKSTLFDILFRLYEPVSGRVMVGGVDYTTYELGGYRCQFAIVPQEAALFNATLKENMTYGVLDYSDEDLAIAIRATKMDEFVAKLPEGLATVVGDKGMKLSGGQKQRIAIIRAFMKHPRIVLMDEPTSSLDAETESVITESMKTLFAGSTVLVAAHRLATIKSSDQIVVLSSGRVSEIGTHDELLCNENGDYKKLYDLQVGLY